MNFIIPHNSKKRKSNGRLPFTEDEDQKLLQIVSKSKPKESDSRKYIQDEDINWKKISKEMGNRSARQCKERYFHYLSPQINKKDWTLEEDSLLISRVASIGKKWKVLEELFENRTEIDIRNRYFVLQRRMAKIVRIGSKRNLFQFSNLNRRQINLNVNQLNNNTCQDREEIQNIDESDEDIDTFVVHNEEPDWFDRIEDFFKDLSDVSFDKYIYCGNRKSLISFFNGHVYDFYYVDDNRS